MTSLLWKLLLGGGDGTILFLFLSRALSSVSSSSSPLSTEMKQSVSSSNYKLKLTTAVDVVHKLISQLWENLVLGLTFLQETPDNFYTHTLTLFPHGLMLCATKMRTLNYSHLGVTLPILMSTLLCYIKTVIIRNTTKYLCHIYFAWKCSYCKFYIYFNAIPPQNNVLFLFTTLKLFGI